MNDDLKERLRDHAPLAEDRTLLSGALTTIELLEGCLDCLNYELHYERHKLEAQVKQLKADLEKALHHISLLLVEQSPHYDAPVKSDARKFLGTFR